MNLNFPVVTSRIAQLVFYPGAPSGSEYSESEYSDADSLGAQLRVSDEVRFRFLSVANFLGMFVNQSLLAGGCRGNRRVRISC